ncbi:uncharacterized protein LOC105012076 isoform X3 [Esox lucius]|uniref:uncharacterized protein LOC105012076 isoform X3 n=1 Tax=Esox lucius TaxID=8010 RepID=UPI0014773F49|nr:uncharacterized protein LOC105012076 isoform X3 [Esox lucius]
MSLRLQGDTTMRTTGSVLVVVIWSVTGTMATECGQTSLVTVSPINPVHGQKVKVTCNAPCSLTDNRNHTYIWYRNGQRLDNTTLQQYTETSYYTHSYSCAVNGFEDLRSPVVCVLGKTCFNVTYTHQRISALNGSTVDLPCTYQHPKNHTVIEMNWYIQQKRDEAPTNLSSLPEYSGRVKYLGDNVSDCTLRITDLRETDSAEYKFRFKTQFAEWGYSFPGTTLTVSGTNPLGPPAIIGIIGFILVLILCLSGFVWFRKKSSTNHTTDSADNRQRDSGPVYDNTSMPVASNAEQTMASDDQTDLHYASVHITRSRDQVVPLYSTVQLPPPQTQEEDVQYTAVKFNCPSAATR